MKKNEGSLDRGIRIVMGIALAVLAFFVAAFWLKVLLGVLAVVALFTGLTGFCLLYRPLGINTRKAVDKKPACCCS